MAEPFLRHRLRQAELRIDSLQHPGWILATERMPLPGETVQCTEGKAHFVRVLGRTDSGGRLLELSIQDGRRTQALHAVAVFVEVIDHVALVGWVASSTGTAP